MSGSYRLSLLFVSWTCAYTPALEESFKDHGSYFDPTNKTFVGPLTDIGAQRDYLSFGPVFNEPHTNGRVYFGMLSRDGPAKIVGVLTVREPPSSPPPRQLKEKSEKIGRIVGMFTKFREALGEQLPIVGSYRATFQLPAKSWTFKLANKPFEGESYDLLGFEGEASYQGLTLALDGKLLGITGVRIDPPDAGDIEVEIQFTAPLKFDEEQMLIATNDVAKIIISKLFLQS